MDIACEEEEEDEEVTGFGDGVTWETFSDVSRPKYFLLVLSTESLLLLGT